MLCIVKSVTFVFFFFFLIFLGTWQDLKVCFRMAWLENCASPSWSMPTLWELLSIPLDTITFGESFPKQITFCYAHYIPLLISFRRVNQLVPCQEATFWTAGKYRRATNSWHCQNLAQVWSFGKQVLPQLSCCRSAPIHLAALVRCRASQPCPFSHHSSSPVQLNIKQSHLWSLNKQAGLCGLTLDVTFTTPQPWHGPPGKLPPIYCPAHMIIWGLVGRGWSWTIFRYLKHKTSRIQPCLTLLLS